MLFNYSSKPKLWIPSDKIVINEHRFPVMTVEDVDITRESETVLILGSGGQLLRFIEVERIKQIIVYRLQTFNIESVQEVNVSPIGRLDYNRSTFV